MDQRAEAIVEPYLQRMTVKVGNGLSRNMNQTLRSYPLLPEIVRRTAMMLIRTEVTLAWSGVHVRAYKAYAELVFSHDDWGYDVPVMSHPDPVLVGQRLGAVFEALAAGEQVPALEDDPILAVELRFQRITRLPYQQFQAAMTVARRIGLFAGPRRIGLEARVRDSLKRAIQSGGGQSEGGTST